QSTYKACYTEKNREKFPFFPKPFYNKKHRSTLNLPFTVFPSVHNCKGTGKEFGSHSYYCAYPHPEDRTGTTYCNCNCHSGNIPHTHGSRQSCSQGLKMAYFSRIIGIIILSPKYLHRMHKKPKWKKFRNYQKVESAAYK